MFKSSFHIISKVTSEYYTNTNPSSIFLLSILHWLSNMSDQDINPTETFFVEEPGSQSPARASISNTHSGFALQNLSNPETSPEADKKGKSIEQIVYFIRKYFVLLLKQVLFGLCCCFINFNKSCII